MAACSDGIDRCMRKYNVPLGSQQQLQRVDAAEFEERAARAMQQTVRF